MPDLSFCGVSFGLFQTGCALFCSLKHVCQMASGQPTVVSVSYREGIKAFCCSIRGVSTGQLPGVGGLPGGTCYPRETEAHYWSWSYSSLLHESKAMFLPVLTFSLMTQIPRCRRQKCLLLTLLITGNWCRLLIREQAHELKYDWFYIFKTEVLIFMAIKFLGDMLYTPYNSKEGWISSSYFLLICNNSQELFEFL